MKKTIGEINFNDYYLVSDVCKCIDYEPDDYNGMRRVCPLECPLRDKDTGECLLDLIKERCEIESKIKKFANVEIEVDEEKLKRIERLQSKGFFIK